MMSWNLWIPNIYQSTQVLSVTFIISANSHYIFIFLETIRSDSFISPSNLLQYEHEYDEKGEKYAENSQIY